MPKVNRPSAAQRLPALIALGANLGPRAQTLDSAVEMLRKLPGVYSLRVSSWHETVPVGGAPGQDVFLNGAALLETDLTAEQLHAHLVHIENSLGRVRAARWDARTIDLDLLLHGQTRCHTPQLTVPHPRMAFRRFVLAPAAEVAGTMLHPVIGWSVAELLAHLEHTPRYIALLGIPGSGKRQLALALADALGLFYVADPVERPHQQQDGAQGSADLASHMYARQLQFLDRGTALSHSAPWRQSQTSAVSDFYFDQCLAYAACSLPHRECESFQLAWAAARVQVAPPQLVIVLDDLLQDNERRGEEDAATRVPCTKGLRHELLRLALRPGVGPAVFVGANNPEAQLSEVLAAIQAMGQPGN